MYRRLVTIENKLFPAHAGVILCLYSHHSVLRTIPRTRGGDPLSDREEGEICAYSPHTRG